MNTTLAAILLLCSATSVSATDFSSLSNGQKLADNRVNIGQYNFTFPEGAWTVVAKQEARAGSQAGSSATPTQLSVAVARVEADKVLAIFILRTPASSFQAVSRWNDDPCKDVGNALVKDTMKQTFSMPECFAITPFDAKPFISSTTGTFEQIGKWLKATQSQLPEKLLRVYYTKYYGGDFLHANLYLPADAQTVPAAEAWGRGVAAAIQKMVTRDSREAAFTTLP